MQNCDALALTIGRIRYTVKGFDWLASEIAWKVMLLSAFHHKPHQQNEQTDPEFTSALQLISLLKVYSTGQLKCVYMDPALQSHINAKLLFHQAVQSMICGIDYVLPIEAMYTEIYQKIKAAQSSFSC